MLIVRLIALQLMTVMKMSQRDKTLCREVLLLTAPHSRVTEVYHPFITSCAVAFQNVEVVTDLRCAPCVLRSVLEVLLITGLLHSWCTIVWSFVCINQINQKLSTVLYAVISLRHTVAIHTCCTLYDHIVPLTACWGVAGFYCCRKGICSLPQTDVFTW